MRRTTQRNKYQVTKGLQANNKHVTKLFIFTIFFFSITSFSSPTPLPPPQKFSLSLLLLSLLIYLFIYSFIYLFIHILYFIFLFCCKIRKCGSNFLQYSLLRKTWSRHREGTYWALFTLFKFVRESLI